MKFSHTQATLGLLWLSSLVAAHPFHVRSTGVHHRVYTRPTNDNTTLEDPVIPEYTIELPLNHSDPSAGTFKNRYFVNDTFFRPEEGGPIVVYDNGEGTANSPNYDDFLMKYAEDYKALVISWEHRYYGKSLPDADFDPADEAADPETLAEWYKHHTIDNALDDLAMFAKNFTWKAEGSEEAKEYRSSDLNWIMIGASYPGNRVAWMQVRHPDVFAFGLASSAPVGFKLDYWEYYVAAERAMARHNLTGCAADIHNAAEWVSQNFEKKNTAALRKFSKVYYTANGTLENMPPANATLDQMATDIMGMWTWPFYSFQEISIYSKNGTIGLADFCGYFQSGANTTTNTTVVADEEKGFSANLNAESVAMLYAKAVGDVYSKNPLPANLSPVDSVSWTYQTCYEVGSFMTGKTERPTNLIPSLSSVESNVRDCKAKYGTGAPDVKGLERNNAKLRKEFNGWDLELNNVVWTNGEFDPWRLLSGDADLEENGGRKWKATTELPKCGQRLPKGVQLSYTIKEGVHGNDLREIYDEEPEQGIVDAATGIRLTLQPPVVDARGAQTLWRKATTTWLKDGCRPKP